MSVYTWGKMGGLRNVFLVVNYSKNLKFESHGLEECETYQNKQPEKTNNTPQCITNEWPEC